MSAARGCEPPSRATGSLCAIVQRVAIRARTNYANARDSYLSSSRYPAERRPSVFAESLKPETHATGDPPQSVRSIDPRFLRRSRNCLCREIKAALCFVLRRIDPPPHPAVRINCGRINARFGRRRLIVRAGVCFHPAPGFEHRHHHLEDAIADEIN